MLPQPVTQATLGLLPGGDAALRGRSIGGYKKAWRASLHDSTAVTGYKDMVLSVLFVQEDQ